jgi:hypothetical protein
METLHEHSQAALATIDRSHPSLVGTWTIDPSDSGVSFAWRTPRLRTTPGRLRCWGVVHLDGLPAVGVIQFEQPSGLPVLTLALDPASVDSVEVLRHRWWTLRSESLEVLPGGTWRVMATLIANGIPELVELHLDVDPGASGPDRLVLRGRGVLDRRAAGVGKRASILDRRIQLHLAVRARRVES